MILCELGLGIPQNYSQVEWKRAKSKTTYVDLVNQIKPTKSLAMKNCPRKNKYEVKAYITKLHLGHTRSMKRLKG